MQRQGLQQVLCLGVVLGKAQVRQLQVQRAQQKRNGQCKLCSRLSRQRSLQREQESGKQGARQLQAQAPVQQITAQSRHSMHQVILLARAHQQRQRQQVGREQRGCQKATHPQRQHIHLVAQASKGVVAGQACLLARPHQAAMLQRRSISSRKESSVGAQHSRGNYSRAKQRVRQGAVREPASITSVGVMLVRTVMQAKMLWDLGTGRGQQVATVKRAHHVEGVRS